MQNFRFVKLASMLIVGAVGVAGVFVGAMTLWNSLDIIRCPAFNKNLSSWFPNQKGESFIFTVGSGQMSNVVTFDSSYIQHRTAYNSKRKCGTCGDVVKATYKIGANTLVVVTEGGDAMFDEPFYDSLNEVFPTSSKSDSTTMQLRWADSVSVSGITAVCFKQRKGLVWYEQNKRRFYCVGKIASASSKSYTGELAISNVKGCQ